MRKREKGGIKYEDCDWAFLIKFCPKAWQDKHPKASYTEASVSVNTVTKVDGLAMPGGIQTVLCRLFWN